MPSVRRMILGHVMSGICSKMNRIKRLDGDGMETPLKRCLTTFDMTFLGVGHMMGAGIYVLTGQVAHSIAGPAIIISFMLAGLASAFSAYCYAEFGARVPKAGSAYVYTYVALGEFWAFVIGWNIILEHMIGAASVARAWSGYVDSLAGGTLSNFTGNLMAGHEMSSSLGHIPDPLACILCLVYALLLGTGVKISSRLNSVLTLVNLGVIGLVVGLGFQYASLGNWTDEKHYGFMPFGIAGVMAGAAKCFYAFVGFDSIASCGEEARNPSKSIPRATTYSMIIVVIGYILLSGMLTLVVPYWEINPTAALSEAFASKGVTWAKYVISIGALCGMTTTLFGSLFSLPRIIYAMASDGLLFSFLGRVNERTQLPIINLAVSGVLCSIIALLFDLAHLVEFMSIGTFLAYTIVSASVIILRYRPSNEIPEFIPSTKTHEGESSSDTSSTSSLTDSSPDDSQLIECQKVNPVGRLKKRYAKLSSFIGNWEPGTAVIAALIIYIAGCSCVSVLLLGLTSPFDHELSWWNSLLYLFVSLIMVACLLVIGAHEQCPATDDKFRVLFVPVVPAISIYINILLMSHLQILTWLRFLVWMFIGILIYFLYGIHHSKEASGPNSYSVLMTRFEEEQAQARSKVNSGLRFKTNRLSQSKKNSDKQPILNADSYR
ncbi:cationic amino acid transporter 4 [Microplitis mediator]|uniref:cationic amino acid transporter 4 n=1 Tax=Microplitis mediator TaxID=375433 RepID=UPI0025548887|nr:cationic amino acid transporter 4 [Microplitis mediator]